MAPHALSALHGRQVMAEAARQKKSGALGVPVFLHEKPVGQQETQAWLQTLPLPVGTHLPLLQSPSVRQTAPGWPVAGLAANSQAVPEATSASKPTSAPTSPAASGCASESECSSAATSAPAISPPSRALAASLAASTSAESLAPRSAKDSETSGDSAPAAVAPDPQPLRNAAQTQAEIDRDARYMEAKYCRYARDSPVGAA